MLTFAISALTLFFVLFILRAKRPAGTNLAWILLILAFPYIGIPFYLMLGARKFPIQFFKNKSQSNFHFKKKFDFELLGIQRILSEACMPKSKGNDFIELVTNGEQAFSKNRDLIQSAKKSIFVSTFILGNDPVAKALIESLTEKAGSGVDVRVLIDSLSTMVLGQPSLKMFKKSGGKVAYFMPIFHLPLRGMFNLRNHRKLLIVDGQFSILGGMNLTEDYMGPEINEKRWVDLVLTIQGACVSDLQNIFLQDWDFATGKTNHSDIEEPNIESNKRGQFAQVIASGPDVVGDPLYDVLLSSIHLAKSEIQIVTPYFIPDESLAKALELAAKRGVKVQILVPRRSNHILADFARGSFIRQLESAGVEFNFYNEMIHAKAVLIDNAYGIFGSANFDMRSLLINYELGLLVYDETILRQVKKWIEACLVRSTQGYPKEIFWLQITEGIGRIIGPLI